MLIAGLTLCLFTFDCAISGTGAGIHVDGPGVNADGVTTYTVTSPYQNRPTAVEVLQPNDMREDKQYPVLYILPVNDGVEGPWGSGIQEARRHDIPNTYHVICVAPEYDYTPWFGDHSSDLTLKQESYLLKVVIPLIEERYPTMNRKEGRLLLGFSKSGFGAITLLLRHLDFIGKAAAWDAPFTSKTILKDEEEMVHVFATEENYRGYYIPGLIEIHADALRNGPPRITLVNNSLRAGPVAQVHDMLTALRIPHQYAEDVKRDHNWTSGWFPVAVRLLFDVTACPLTQVAR